MKKAILTLALVALLGGASPVLANDGRGYMGVSVTGVHHNTTGSPGDGVYIASVQAGSGAEAAGLKAKDRIVSINGIEISSTPDLDIALGSSTPGQGVTVSVMRGGSPHTFDVILSDKPERAALAFGAHGDKRFGKWVIESGESTPRMGVELQPLGSQLAGYFQVTSGMLVTRVIEDSGAWRAGLQAGDVLLEVNGASITNVGEIRSALEGLKPGDLADVTVQRRGSVNHFSITLEEAAGFSHGEMRFNVALHDDHQDGDDHDVTVDLQGVDESFELQGDLVTVRFGDAHDEAALQHEIYQLRQELHRLHQELDRLRND